jgi:hypothetical protein
LLNPVAKTETFCAASEDAANVIANEKRNADPQERVRAMTSLLSFFWTKMPESRGEENGGPALASQL